MYVEDVHKDADARSPGTFRTDQQDLSVSRRNRYLAGRNLALGVAEEPGAKGPQQKKRRSQPGIGEVADRIPPAKKPSA